MKMIKCYMCQLFHREYYNRCILEIRKTLAYCKYNTFFSIYKWLARLFIMFIISIIPLF